jgi:hypothetical protein
MDEPRSGYALAPSVRPRRILILIDGCCLTLIVARHGSIAIARCSGSRLPLYKFSGSADFRVREAENYLRNAAWILAYLLVLVFLQAFLDWLFTFKRPSKLGSMGVISPRAAGKKWRSGIVWVIATAFWLAIGVGMQNAVSYAVGTIVAFQKNHDKPK